MSAGKIPCENCGVEIQTMTAARTGSLCMPCAQRLGRHVPSASMVPCSDCRVEIYRSLAAENGGLCWPCRDKREYEPFQKKVRPLWARKIVPPHSRWRFGRAIFGPRANRRTNFAGRYQAGDRDEVWNELHELDLRKPMSQDDFDDAIACVRLTMQRIRTNVEMVVEGLTALGYEFWSVPAHTPPTPSDLATLATLEERYGPLPLTLRLFYEEVGAVDLRQDLDQWEFSAEDSESQDSLGTLCAYDPLCVMAVSSLDGVTSRITRAHLDPPERRTRMRFYIGPDEQPKRGIYCDGAAFAGVLMGYYLFLPEPAVDFPLVEQSPEPPGEFFMTYLRESFKNAGFRGKSGCKFLEGRIRRPPQWAPLAELAAKLLPV